MAVKWISEAWESDLKTRVFQTERVYLDFRQEIYPPYASDLTYTLMTVGDNQPGSHNLTGGSADYILELTDPITIRARVYPNFAYNVGSNQPILSWYIDATHKLVLYYADAGAEHRYAVYWIDGGTGRTLLGPQYSDNSHQVWTDIDLIIDFANKQATLYLDRVGVDNVWSGTPDAKSHNYPLLSIRHENGTEGDYKINHIRAFMNLEATPVTQVANDYKSVKNEEIIWHFNGEGCGRTRCNVTRFVQNLYNEKGVEDPSNGAAGANTCSVTLLSSNGEFADDQYDAGGFDPTTDAFNGLVTQKYMQNRCRLEVETWYDHDYELVFTGRLDENSFARTSGVGALQIVTIGAEDLVSDIARKFRRKAITYENKKISDATEADSLVHLIARLATKDPIYNFLANSSFENATIGNSWVVSGGTTPTFSRVAGGLFGVYQGDLVYDDATCKVAETITFTGIKKLNVGETWNFSIYLKATANAAGDVAIYEADVGGDNDNTVVAYDTLASAIGWDKFEVSHVITDSDSDRLRLEVTLETDTTLSMDGAMLIQNDRAINWFILNDNDGAAGVESADDADSDSYDLIGFDCDAVNITHPWVLIEQGGNVWDELRLVGDAAGAMYNGLDESGTYKFRAKLATGYADPTSLETIDDAEIEGVSTFLEMEQANKIVVHGVNIKKFTNQSTLWTAQACGNFSQGTGQIIAEVVADGTYWPSTADGDFYAKYGEV